MENASKALLIAAGIFLAVLIVSLLVVFYNQMSAFYEQEHDATVIEQAQEFNARFENYHRDSIRGSDLISLMNRVIDYNATQSYFEGTDYERIRVTINLGGTQILNQFKYDNEDYKNEYLTTEITNTKNGDKWQNDKKLVAITNTSVDLCEKLGKLGVRNPTDAQLQQLSSNISNILVDEEADWARAYRFKRADVLQDVLGIKVGTSTDCDIRIYEATGKTRSDPKQIITGVKEITSQYYQYTQFKRAYFDCTEVKYYEETNRVVEMNFNLQVKNGEVVFN